MTLLTSLMLRLATDDGGRLRMVQPGTTGSPWWVPLILGNWERNRAKSSQGMKAPDVLLRYKKGVMNHNGLARIHVDAGAIPVGSQQLHTSRWSCEESSLS
jgi:hypothetical protein